MKIAAFDMDGTILFEDGIARETLDAIHAWRDAGNLAVLATGKSLAAAQHALQDHDLAFDFSVLFTGAVVTGDRWDVLRQQTLERPVVHRIVEELSGIDGIAVYATMLEGRDIRFHTSIPDETPTSILTDFRDLPLSEIDTVADGDFVGVPVRVPDNATLRDRVYREISDRFEVDCVVNQNFVDILPVGTSKGAGLEWILGHLSLRREDVELVSFGDSWNDLPMHAVADRSFSFPWSPVEVREQTTGVAGSVAEVLPHLI